jgi:hypothetical protein
MNKTILKYTLTVLDEQTILMPKGAGILYFATQYEEPRIWAKVDPTAELVPRHFHTYSTGDIIPEENEKGDCFLGSYQLRGGSEVYHVFENRPH